MATIAAPPNFERSGVVAGFILGPGAGLTPTVSKGVLFAQGALYRPAVAPVLPPVPAGGQVWLHYNSFAGFYWSPQPAPPGADDAGPVGWVVTDASQVLAVSRQQFEFPEPAQKVTVISLGPILDQGPGNVLTYGDAAIPPLPIFGITVPRDGKIIFTPIGFASLVNTNSIDAATYWVSHVDEIAPTSTTLSAAALAGDPVLHAASSANFVAGQLVALDSEILELSAINGTQWTVLRGRKGTAAAAHSAGADIYLLSGKAFLFPFDPQFFSTPEAAIWRTSESFPSARIAAVEMSVHNAFGDSPTAVQEFLSFQSDPGASGTRPGLRTNKGGEYVMQADGTLAIEAAPSPPLPVAIATSVRDVFARLALAPAGAGITITVKRNGAAYATVTIPAGQTVSNTVSGAALAALQPGDLLTFDITGVGSTYPGSDLTVVVRL